jgi:hypothetical protein
MSIYLHLVSSHACAVGAVATLAVLLVAFRSGVVTVYRLAYGFLFATAFVAAVAFFSGPPAYERLMASYPSTERDYVESHALLGNAVFIVLVLVGVLSLVGFKSRPRDETPSPIERWGLLAGVIIACLLLAWSAHLGGLIRHPEIR